MSAKELAVQVFINSPAFVLLKITLTGVVGWLFSQIAGGLGLGNIKNYITVTTVFVCLYFCAGTIWKAVSLVLSYAGVH